MYTKEQNLKAGRMGYGRWKSEMEVVIRPADYGFYLLSKKKGGRSYGFSRHLRRW